MKKSRLEEILSGFPAVRIAVVGDFFLDKHLLIDRALDEPSLETGLTAYQVVGKHISPGAAGNVMSNLSALSVGTLYAVGFRGEDGEGWELEEQLHARRVDTRLLVRRPGLFTPTYTKPMFLTRGTPEEGSRLDIRNRSPLPAELEDEIIRNLREAAEMVDAVIALDQVAQRNTGVITDRVRQELSALGRERPGLIIYADSRAFSTQFRDVIVKCNHLEACAAVYPGLKGEPDDGVIRECALSLSGRTARPAFVTCGGKGIYAVRDGEAVLVPAPEAEGPVDICGAGDSATSGIVSALCRGASAKEAAFIGNLTASVTIRQLGVTGTATREQLLGAFDKLHNS